MAQPTTYNRQTSFANYQAQNPTLPLSGATLDAELNAVKVTLDEILANVEIIQRDDGYLANESVGLDQLSPEIEVGWQAPEVWVTATAYVVGNTVFHGSGFYRVLIAHTAGTFATDLAASKLELIVDLSALTIVAASAIAVTPTGGISSVTVQAALAELDSEKAALSHTHLSSAISDGTAAGRALLTAADAAAQRTALELGALALEDTLPVTDIGAQIAFTGDISPSALLGNTNDWAPTGVAACSRIRASASSAINLTGLLAGTDGERKVIENIGSYNITLTSSDAASAAANRFAIPAAVVLRPNQSIEIEYDGTDSRWRTVHCLTAPSPSAIFKNLRVFNVATYFGDSAPGTPNTQIKVAADSLVLEDGNGETYLARSVSVTADTASSGANGLDTGSAANSTWYSVWVIYNPTTNTVAGLLSASATTPTMPSGYTFKVRVGWNRTNGSAQFNRVVQYGRRAQYVVSASVTTAMPIVATGLSGSTSVPTWTATAIGNYVPSTASVLFGMLLISTTNGGGTVSAICAPNNSYGAAFSTSNPPPAQVTGYDVGGLGTAAASPFSFELESSNIYYAAGNGNGRVFCLGWEDSL